MNSRPRRNIPIVNYNEDALCSDFTNLSINNPETMSSVGTVDLRKLFENDPQVFESELKKKVGRIKACFPSLDDCRRFDQKEAASQSIIVKDARSKLIVHP